MKHMHKAISGVELVAPIVPLSFPDLLIHTDY